jgi:hypothetical protein
VHVDQQVGRLDVAMEDAEAVGVLQGLSGLQAQVGDGPEEGAVSGQGAAWRARSLFGEGLTTPPRG